MSPPEVSTTISATCFSRSFSGDFRSGISRRFSSRTTIRWSMRSRERTPCRSGGYRSGSWPGRIRVSCCAHLSPKSTSTGLMVNRRAGFRSGHGVEMCVEPEGGEPAPMEIHRGGLVYMKAPSGLGKTTLVKMMMGLIRGKKLRILFNGEEGVRITEKTPRRFWQTSIWGKKMTMTFQHADEALNPRSTVAETFRMLPARKRVTDADIRRTLGELFDEEITDEFLSRPVSNLSGGQKQRLNLLRGFFLEPDILILDEPLNGLDFDSTRRVIAKLREKQDAGKGILLISHNEEIFDALIPPDSVYYLHRA